MIFQCDAAALEIRVAAFLSQDEVLIQEFINGEDLHTSNQIKFGLPDRGIAKVLNFRILYGGNEFSFAQDPDFTSVSKSREYWKEVIEAYYTKYAGISAWHKKIIKTVIETGELSTPLGRFFKFQKYGGEYTPTTIKNYPVQGTGADIMALVRVSAYNRLKKLDLPDCLLVNTVHDSIILDFKDAGLIPVLNDMFHGVFKDIPANIEKVFGVKFNVPMTCENQVGSNWGDMVVVN